MSISSVTGTAFFSAIRETQAEQNGQSKFQQIQSEFQQLGSDLQAGNLTQAQQDFATLSQNFPAPQTQSQNKNNPIANAFNALAQDLQNGNLSGAQQDFANLQQAAQQQQQQGGQVHHHHHHHGGGQQSSQIAQAFQSLGQALQSGDLSGAQSAFATLQQDLQQFNPFGSTAAASGTSSSAAQTAGTNLNVTA